MGEWDDDLDALEDERGRLTLNDALAPGLLRDRFRLQVINAAEAEAQKHGMEVSPPVMSALVDLTVKFTEQLARDLEMFAQHAGRKSVNIDDVILSARRNEDVLASLKAFSQELLKGKEKQVERKRKKAASKGESSAMDVEVDK
ncbi:protein MHF1 homolog [Cryptomeria japonica]|uniref:protein MHF1 homolog n=1 Tax=Cryptomeria japonica TaxID=3369 RepID=UPI0025AC4AE6|nr:protein MHF1 homolog [Cryptomeria japonica]